jgi:hypothetical protein
MLEIFLKLWENRYLIILSIHILKLEISGCDNSSWAFSQLKTLLKTHTYSEDKMLLLAITSNCFSFLVPFLMLVIFELHNITTSSNGNLTYTKFVSLNKLWNFCVQRIFIRVHFVFRLTEFWPSQTWILKFELLMFCFMKKWLNPTQ